MNDEIADGNLAEKIPDSAKKIQEEYFAELGTDKKEEKNSTVGAIPGAGSAWSDKDFISDDVMGLILGLKNSYLVSVLAKGMGQTEEKMLRDLYEVSDKELSLYKKILQNFIRENFSEYIDQIAKLTNGELTAILILETIRYKSAQDLIKASKDISKKDQK